MSGIPATTMTQPSNLLTVIKTSLRKDIFLMASKKTKKKKTKQQKKRAKALKSSLSRQKKMNLAFTTTGELFQPVRIHYKVSDASKLKTLFSSMKCMDYDPGQKRWVWLYAEEARSLKFKEKRDEENPVVLGEFFFENSSNMVLNLRSHERVIYAIEFFDEHIPRSVMEAADITTINKLFSLQEATSVSTLNQLFETDNMTIRDPEQITKDLLELQNRDDDENDMKKVVNDYIFGISKEKTPEIEKFPTNYYEDGIDSVRYALRLRQVVAAEHWKGNTDFNAMDAIREALKKSPISI